MAANAEERERWNDERRYTIWPKREQLTSEVTGHLMAALAPQPGERILDVGTGGGRSALAAAELVAPDGAVVGADISEGLLRLARDRAEAASAGNVSFVLADAQTESIPGGPFDAATSQFGVMFFDEPVTAFRNIAAQLRPGGRIAFACWQEPKANPWFPGHAVRDLMPAPEPPAPGKSPTGPFSLADPAHTTRILEQAGFAAVRRTGLNLTAEASEDAVVDETQLDLMGIPADRIPAAMETVSRYMAQFTIDGGRSRFPLAVQIFAATKP